MSQLIYSKLKKVNNECSLVLKKKEFINFETKRFIITTKEATHIKLKLNHLNTLESSNGNVLKLKLLLSTSPITIIGALHFFISLLVP